MATLQTLPESGPAAWARRLRRLLVIYARLQLLHVRAHLEYETDFWVGIVAVFLRHGAGVAFLWVLFSNVQAVGGWTRAEMLFLYGLLVLPRGLVEVLANGQWRLSGMINEGELDRLLVRPLSPVVQVLTQESAIHGVGSIVLGCLILGYAAGQLHLVWTVGRALLLAATIASSVLLIASVTLATNSIGFWVPTATGAFPNFVNNLMELVKFPITIYGQALQWALTVILPFAFVSYYPSVALLGKPGPYAWLAYLSPLAGPAVAWLVSRFWRRGLARYQGAGH